MSHIKNLLENLEDFEFDRLCESSDCEFVADYLVWISHHRKGCNYTGYRCVIHRNLLILQTVRHCAPLRAGNTGYCGKCGAIVTDYRIEDHLRWVKL